jgi:hypothetical protein
MNKAPVIYKKPVTPPAAILTAENGQAKSKTHQTIDVY